MEQSPSNIRGMPVNQAREYILSFITTQKVNEKKLLALKNELEKWKNRILLARNSGGDHLTTQASAACQDIENQIRSLEVENTELNVQIKSMIGQLPGLAARERSIDPDLLEQELLLAAGFTPGESLPEKREFAALEQEQTVEAALLELKQKMRLASPDDKPEQ
jgi:phage shock protein A